MKRITSVVQSNKHRRFGKLFVLKAFSKIDLHTESMLKNYWNFSNTQCIFPQFFFLFFFLTWIWLRCEKYFPFNFIPLSFSFSLSLPQPLLLFTSFYENIKTLCVFIILSLEFTTRLERTDGRALKEFHFISSTKKKVSVSIESRKLKNKLKISF